MTTEQKILQAAEKVFVRDGYDGARMKTIADELGMNKALLHYYFNSKANLFEQVFTAKLGDFLPKVGAYFFGDHSLLDKMDHLVDAYFDMMSQNPDLPMFILNTMHRNPDFARLFPASFIEGVIAYIQSEVDAGNIRPVVPRQFFISVLSMCIFPFLARPILRSGLGVDQKAFPSFILERRAEVKRYLRAILAV